MSAQSELALEHQARIIARTDRAAQQAVRLWRGIDPDALDAGWLRVGPQITASAASVVLANARDSQSFTNRFAAADDMSAGDVIVPSSFVGVDGSGRDMESLLHGAVTTTKQGMGAGLGLQQSFLSGASYLATMFSTAVHDMGRSSDLVASTGRGYTYYVRVVNPGACSRCAMLAGIRTGSKPFQRHPNCHCTSAPVRVAGDKHKPEIPDGLFANPTEYFNSLPKAEQDRVFTNAGAEAIRSGADIDKVVGARRRATGISYSSHGVQGATRAGDPFKRGVLQRTRIGTAADGSPVYGYETREATTRRGSFGRVQRQAFNNSNRVRLMPETIIPLTDDPELRRVLLRNSGYLDYSRAPELKDRRFVSAAESRGVDPRQFLIRQDQFTADKFYAQHGIRLG